MKTELTETEIAEQRTQGEWMYSKHGNTQSFGICTQEKYNDLAIITSTYKVSYEEAEANAAYICQAVNNYQNLIEENKKLRAYQETIKNTIGYKKLQKEAEKYNQPY